MNKNKIVFLFLFFTFLLYSQSELKEPSWIYLKKAENLLSKGEYSDAIVEARKSHEKFIEEKLESYYNEIFYTHRDKTQYELKKMVNLKREELNKDDNYPAFHEIMGELYIKTNFMDEAVKEFKKALLQNKYFEYPQKSIELKYKLASVYNKKNEYELEDLIYREIAKEFFDKKKNDYWDRIKYYIENDATLNHAYRIYRLSGIEYLEALYKVGRRSSILEKDKEALFYLTCASIVWFTYFSEIIKNYNSDFQFSTPVDFINYLLKIRSREQIESDLIIGEIFFYIGYTNYILKRNNIKDYFYNFAISFSKNTKKEEEIKNRINYLKIDKNYILKFDEIK